ncbi:MAG: cation transporter [Candidatus Eisenbacteria bacterium]|nr:cation transporter [Candidatus Eisenbacteria bacterium]
MPRSEIAATAALPPERRRQVARALGIEYLTVGWNVVEGVIGVTAALAAGSVALLGFGLDSFIECASGLVLVWRLRAESGAGGGGVAPDHAAIERLDRRAHRLVGGSLFLLAAWVAGDALWSLVRGERPEPSVVGIALTAISLGVMVWLARAKRRAAARLASRALAADAFQTTACWWLSLVTLGGIGLNALLGWWWADPVAALGMTFFLVREGREAWKGEGCGCH